MADQFADETDRRLSSLAGLQEAGIIDSFHFNPFTGFAGLVYTPNWMRILESGMVLLVDSAFSSAILADDLVAMRTFVELEGARLAMEEESKAPPRQPGPLRKSRR